MQAFAVLAEPFEQEITSERDAAEKEWRVGVRLSDVSERGFKVGRVARVVIPWGPIHLFATAAAYHDVQAPGEFLGPFRQRCDELGSGAALEAVKHDKTRRGVSRLCTVDLKEVIVRSGQTFHAHWDVVALPKKLPPEGLTVSSWQPPGGDEPIAHTSRFLFKSKGPRVATSVV